MADITLYIPNQQAIMYPEVQVYTIEDGTLNFTTVAKGVMPQEQITTNVPFLIKTTYRR